MGDHMNRFPSCERDTHLLLPSQIYEREPDAFNDITVGRNNCVVSIVLARQEATE